MKPNGKAEFQVNMEFGPGVISASGIYGIYKAPNLPSLLRKIQKGSGFQLHQITLSFQPTTEAIASTLAQVNGK